MAYIECTRTPAIPRYKEFNVYKDGALLVTPTLSALNDLKDYGVNVCPFGYKVDLELPVVDWVFMVECLQVRRVSSSASSGVPLGRLEDGFF